MQTNNGKQSHIHPYSAVLSLRIEQWAPPSLSFPPSLQLMREKRIFEKEDGRKGFSLLSTKMHDEQLPRVHSNEKNTTLTFTAMVEKVNVV